MEASSRTTKQRLLLALVTLVALGALALGLVLRKSGGERWGQELSAVESALGAAHRKAGLARLQAACRERDCACASSAIRSALDADAGKAALGLSDVAAVECAAEPTWDGLRAEALVRSGDKAAGTRAAGVVLKRSSRDAHALMALALAYRDARSGASYAEASAESGRGAVAASLRGLFAYVDGDFAGASTWFERALQQDPEELQALYNLALTSQRLGRYHQAREGYMRALALDPNLVDARHNLVVLTHRAGAESEARHHLQKLRAAKPDPEVIAKLEQLLSRADTNANSEPAVPAALGNPLRP